MSTAHAVHSGSLTAEHKDQYDRDGFVTVRGMFTPAEMSAFQREAEVLFGRSDLIDSANIRCRWQNHATTGECRFDCFDPVIDISPLFATLARDPRLIGAVSTLYREQACLFKDKLIFKPPFAQGYAMHQDYISWKSFPQSFVTAIVAIDPADASNGATQVFSGYHKLGCMTAKDGMYHELTPEQVDFSEGVTLDLEPGDVAIFSGFTPHRSGPNQSDQWRRLAYLSYNALSDGGEQRHAHYAEFKEWLMERYAEYGKTNVFFK